jgi:hypothetical protein
MGERFLKYGGNVVKGQEVSKTLQDEGTIIFRNVGNQSPTPHQEDLNLHQFNFKNIETSKHTSSVIAGRV